MTRIVTDAAAMSADHLHKHLDKSHKSDWAVPFDRALPAPKWPCSEGHDTVVMLHDKLHELYPDKYDHDHDEQ